MEDSFVFISSNAGLVWVAALLILASAASLALIAIRNEQRQDTALGQRLGLSDNRLSRLSSRRSMLNDDSLDLLAPESNEPPSAWATEESAGSADRDSEKRPISAAALILILVFILVVALPRLIKAEKSSR